jgi:RNA polymerase sigma-70 factor, ECF subfamily
MIDASAAQRVTNDELELARRIGAHDERAFESMMRAHNRLLYRLARSILHDDAEAEDAVQDAYLSAYRNIARFRGGAKLSTWLARIAINEAYARLRKRRQPGVVVPLGSVGDPVHCTASPLGDESMADTTGSDPEHSTLRAELRKLLEKHIDALPEPFRLAFILRDVEEMSVDEAAACLDLPPATVRTRAFRARALLRASLSRDIDTATIDAFAFAGERCNRIVANVLHRLRSIEAASRGPG